MPAYFLNDMKHGYPHMKCVDEMNAFSKISRRRNERVDENDHTHTYTCQKFSKLCESHLLEEISKSKSKRRKKAETIFKLRTRSKIHFKRNANETLRGGC